MGPRERLLSIVPRLTDKQLLALVEEAPPDVLRFLEDKFGFDGDCGCPLEIMPCGCGKEGCDCPLKRLVKRCEHVAEDDGGFVLPWPIYKRLLERLRPLKTEPKFRDGHGDLPIPPPILSMNPDAMVGFRGQRFRDGFGIFHPFEGLSRNPCFALKEAVVREVKRAPNGSDIVGRLRLACHQFELTDAERYELLGFDEPPVPNPDEEQETPVPEAA